MSDVNINTSWTITPGGDYEYNGVLGCSGYDPDDNRLFVSAQAPPNVAGNVRTEYARGFHMSADYNGNLVCSPADNASADLKRVRFTMSFAGSAYDLTDCRTYCQFANYFNVNIAAWKFAHVATDNTETTLASGSTIAQNGQIQIDFKNDYGAGQFYFEFEYNAEIPDPIVTTLGGKWYKLPVDAYPTYVTGWYYRCNDANTDMYIALVNNQTIFCTQESGKYIQLITPREVVSTQVQASNYIPNKGYHNNYGFSSDNRPWIENSATAYAGMSYYDIANDFLTYISGGISGGGVDTTDFNNYDGRVYACRMFANIAGVSPGPMATESEGGELGDFDITSDQITAPALPTTITVGGVRLYRVTAAQLNEFRDYIWNPDILNSLFNNFSDRANGIMSIMQVPTGTYPDIAADQHILIGSSEIYYDDLQGRHYATGTTISRYGQVDCGSVDLHLFWDSALDLNPYTKLTAYIPCVGTVPLNADEVMGHTIGLYYNIDFLSGAGVAVLTIDGDYLSQYPCNMSTPIGISGEQFSRVYQSMIAAMASGAIGYAAAGTGGALAGAVANTASALMTSKIDRERAGNFGAGTALMAQLQPYIEILRPIQQLPRDYTKFNAYPSYMTAQLINLSGYVEVQDIRLDDIDCTDAERTELLNMLQSGVIL